MRTGKGEIEEEEQTERPIEGRAEGERRTEGGNRPTGGREGPVLLRPVSAVSRQLLFRDPSGPFGGC